MADKSQNMILKTDNFDLVNSTNSTLSETIVGSMIKIIQVSINQKEIALYRSLVSDKSVSRLDGDGETIIPPSFWSMSRRPSELYFPDPLVAHI